MNNIQLTVEKATASSNGGFILKLVNSNSVATAFGNKEQNITYYMKVKELATHKVNNRMVPIGAGYVADLDLDEMVVVERDYVIPEGENAGDIIPLKWLQLQPATA